VTRLALLLLVGLAALSAPPALDAHPGSASTAPRPPIEAAADRSRIEEGPGSLPRSDAGVPVPAAAGTPDDLAVDLPPLDRAPGTPPVTGRTSRSLSSIEAAGLLAALLLILTVRRAGVRRAVVLAGLAATLAFAFETGVHSVHHLGEPPGASECATATAASTVVGTADSPSVWTASPAPCSAAPADIDASQRPASPPAPFQGRAPPPR
jgi:hypothetical protein